MDNWNLIFELEVLESNVVKKIFNNENFWLKIDHKIFS